MTVMTHTAISDAMESSILRVEGSLLSGFSGMHIVGHLSEVCKSGLERARAALENIGFKMPQKRMLFSVLPADIKKDGAQFDLPFAVCMGLLASGKTPVIDPQRWLFAGELALSGEIRPVKGAVSFALSALEAGFDGMVLSPGNLDEVRVLLQLKDRPPGFQLMAFHDLTALQAWLTGTEKQLTGTENQLTAPFETHISSSFSWPPTSHSPDPTSPQTSGPNFDDMRLTPGMVQIASVVATGLHNLLLYGAPGTGKSMFSERLVSILPPMESRDHLDALKIHSLYTGHIQPALLVGRPPFRAPHHQSTTAAVLGIPDTPGEISLAHGGVLFLDELPEFRRDIIESLREPLEVGHIRVSRAKRKVQWRSRFILIAACNNCPCGWLGSRYRVCSCPTPKILAYRRKLSGPILDRIDLHINVPEDHQDRGDFLLSCGKGIQDSALTGSPHTPLSLTQQMSAKVCQAKAFATDRNLALGVFSNRDLQAQHMLTASGLDEDAFSELCTRGFPAQVSRRAVIRVLRVARTLADLEASPCIRAHDLALALSWQADGAAKERGDYAYGV